MARQVSYCAGLGLEEGLQANNADAFSVTTPWFFMADMICKDMRFDQVWVDVVHSGLGAKVFSNPRWLDFFLKCAPVRLGFIRESLEYSEEEFVNRPSLRTRKAEVTDRLKYFTHVLAYDEVDVAHVTGENSIPTIWWPQAVPERYITQRLSGPANPCGSFTGTVYRARADWLRASALQGLLKRSSSPENRSFDRFLFWLLSSPVRFPHEIRSHLLLRYYPTYLRRLRKLRRKFFRMWLDGLAESAAIVNLPHMVKSYAGRVVEGIAAGRPVISWEIPDRPRNKNLFEDGKEILLFDKEHPEQLAQLIQRVRTDSEWAETVAENAQKKLKRFHTMEIRVRQILDWISRGDIPDYGA